MNVFLLFMTNLGSTVQKIFNASSIMKGYKGKTGGDGTAEKLDNEIFLDDFPVTHMSLT